MTGLPHFFPAHRIEKATRAVSPKFARAAEIKERIMVQPIDRKSKDIEEALRKRALLDLLVVVRLAERMGPAIVRRWMKQVLDTWVNRSLGAGELLACAFCRMPIVGVGGELRSGRPICHQCARVLGQAHQEVA